MPTDWERLHEQLRHAAAALDQRAGRTPDQARRILRERAKELAAEGDGTDPGTALTECLEFRLAREDYSIELSAVREVYRLRQYAEIPGLPPHVLGVASMRGRVISVVNLKTFFELPDTGISDLNKVIVIGDENLEFGILADTVSGVRRIALSGLQPPPATGGTRAGYLRGVTVEGVIILDAASLLGDESLVVSHPAGEAAT